MVRKIIRIDEEKCNGCVGLTAGRGVSDTICIWREEI